MRIEKYIFYFISGVLLCDPNSPLVQLLSDLVLERGRHSPTPINLQTQEKLSSLRLPKQQVQFQRFLLQRTAEVGLNFSYDYDLIYFSMFFTTIFRSCELSKKYNLFLDITMGENASKGDSVTTTSDGVIVWKVGPSQINQLILGLRNADDPSKQKIDGRGRDLGIVLRSVEFLKHDLDFEMSGSEFSIVLRFSICTLRRFPMLLNTIKYVLISTINF